MHDAPAAPPGPIAPAALTDEEAHRLARLACDILTGDGFVDAQRFTLVVDVTVELAEDDRALLLRLFGPGISYVDG